MRLGRSELAACFDRAVRPVVTCVSVPAGVLGRNLVRHQDPSPVVTVVVFYAIYRGASNGPPIAVSDAHFVPLLYRHNECGKVRAEEWRKRFHGRDGEGEHDQSAQSGGPSPHVSDSHTP